MTKLLYLKLACRNLSHGRQTYLPFLIASSLLTFALYSFSMICFNPGMWAMPGAESFMLIMDLGLIVVGLFTAVFLFYANSFLIRRRKKELGLYSILGMEKKHVIRVLRHEMMLCYLITMVFGLGLGMLLARLLFLVIRTLCQMAIPLTDGFSLPAILVTVCLMAVLFLCLLIYNALQVHLSHPVELLHSQQAGEKEPKARWILSVLGLVCMVAGYIIAQQVQSPMEAIALFFVAVLLVIAGTYQLFLTGSIALLKVMKKRQSFYYTPKHFVTVSGMLFRMKQNATGLASIVILCTMAMITIGTTVALYSSSEDMLSTQYPTDWSITVDTEADVATVMSTLELLEADSPVQPAQRHIYRSYDFWALIDNDALQTLEGMNEEDMSVYSKMYVGELLTEADFNALEGTALNLAEDEIAWYGDALPEGDTLTVMGKNMRVQRLTDLPVPNSCNTGSAYNTGVMVVKDDATAQAIATYLEQGMARNSQVVDKSMTAEYTVQWNITGTEQEKRDYGDLVSEQVQAALREMQHETSYSVRLSDKAAMRWDWYGMYGSFLFVGVFLGLVFLMGTALIIYFKQVSEGYQDHDRYIILQKVGMSRDEVKASVRRQILIVFFLPLAVALCHVAGSLHMITLLLRVFGLVNVPYISLMTLGAALVVGLIYLVFYRRTAKTYLKLVQF